MYILRFVRLMVKIYIGVLFFIIRLMIMLVTQDPLDSNDCMIMMYERERMWKEVVDLNLR
jgi:hypothetical protein